MQKVIPLGDIGSVTIAEAGGVASVKLSVSASAGGGAAAGVAKGSASVEVDLGAEQAADLAFGLLEAKFPSVAPLLKAAQTEVDSLLSAST